MVFSRTTSGGALVGKKTKIIVFILTVSTKAVSSSYHSFWTTVRAPAAMNASMSPRGGVVILLCRRMLKWKYEDRLDSPREMSSEWKKLSILNARMRHDNVKEEASHADSKSDDETNEG